MKIEILTEEFSICRDDRKRSVDLSAEMVFISRTDEELSLVCPTNIAPDDFERREDGWRGMRICGQLDFSLIGILAKVSTALADKKIGIFVVSTYNTDYIFVKRDKLNDAVDALCEMGCEIE